MDTRDARRMQLIMGGRNRVFEMFAKGAPVAELLDAMLVEAERALPEVRLGIFLLDPESGRLRLGAAPSMPRFFLDALAGLRIGPNVGSCGAAAYTGQRVIVEDVMLHPNWESLRELASAAEFRACWSEPILSSSGEILGTFAMYHAEPCVPSAFELDFIHRTAQVAAVAIDGGRAKQELRASEERFRQLAESIREVFWLTDWANNKTLYVSPAYESVWGRTCESLLDDSKSWSYDIHPEDRERVVEAFRRADEGAYEVEYRIVRGDGSVRWIYDRAFPVRNADGAIYRVAGLSEDVTERKNAEEALSQARQALDARNQQKLESLTTELLLAEEHERRKLALDLHDGLNQLLSLARIKVGALRGSTASDLSAPLSDLEDLLDRANRSARSLTFQLSPPILHDLGFEPAVQWLVEDVQESYGLKIALHEHGGDLQLDDRVRVLLFRAVRELLINVAKHAHAHEAVVRIHSEEHRLVIAVEDDGVAFDPEARGTRGLGLGSIEERLSNLGGSMSIRSSRGSGTVITLVAPMLPESL